MGDTDVTIIDFLKVYIVTWKKNNFHTLHFVAIDVAHKCSISRNPG